MCPSKKKGCKAWCTTASGGGLYSPLQWIVQSATVDCTVHCRRL